LDCFRAVFLAAGTDQSIRLRAESTGNKDNREESRRIEIQVFDSMGFMASESRMFDAHRRAAARICAELRRLSRRRFPLRGWSDE